MSLTEKCNDSPLPSVKPLSGITNGSFGGGGGDGSALLQLYYINCSHFCKPQINRYICSADLYFNFDSLIFFKRRYLLSFDPRSTRGA